MTTDAVTVFVALRKPASVTLTVSAVTSAGGAGATRCTGTAPTVGIGANLHVVAVTATAPGAIVPGATYVYDLALTPQGESTRSLLDAGVVADTGAAARQALTYEVPGAPALPSFTAPPPDPRGLRILHVSCRKPHGHGTDALPTVDRMIRDSFTATGPDAAPRPHLLVHTGDQIYADDVADHLLYVLIDAADALLGWTPGEQLPLPGGAAAPRTLRPGLRIRTALEGGLTSGAPFGRKPPDQVDDDVVAKWGQEPRSHLLGFGEFCAMYLHAWSPTLWPPAMPTEAELYPGATPEQLEAHRKAVSDQRTRVGWGYGPFVADVRRLLANVPSLMQFDDHEVTDDWFLNLAWLKRAQDPATPKGRLGRSIVRNGMAAFAVFQGWGNVPERFVAAPGPVPVAGAEILRLLNTWHGDGGRSDSATGSNTLELLEKLLGLPTGFGIDRATRDANAIDWHFHHTWPGHQLVVLDTRTVRSTPGAEGEPPALISAEDLVDQFAQVPVPGADDLVLVVSPAPVFGAEAHEKLGKTRQHMVDPEHWSLQEAAWERLLARVVTRRPADATGVRRSRTVILSGDVHYASTLAVHYKGRPYEADATTRVEAAIAQLTSSASKNQDSKTIGIAYGASAAMPAAHRYGWTNPGGGPFPVTTATGTETRNGSPVVVDVPNGPGPLAEWDVDILPQRDVRLGISHLLSLPPAGGGLAGAVEAGKWAAGVVATELSGRRIVGRNNVGDIRFRWEAGDDKKVMHHLWYRAKDADPLAAPHTLHVVDLAVGLPAASTDPTLRRGDHDRDAGGIARYDGADRVEPAPGSGLVARRQAQLAQLGFSLVGPADGLFDAEMEEAVREFQIAAGSSRAARSTSGAPSDPTTHEPVVIGTAERYAGAIDGRIDQALAGVIDGWVARGWANPVWARAQQGATVTATTVWRFDDPVPAGSEVSIRDLSDLWPLPGGRAAADYHPAGRFLATAGGPVAVAPDHTWAQAELLPAVLTGTTPTVVQRSTFKVVRAVSERECGGFLDSVATSSNALLEAGTFHWTFGLPNGALRAPGELAGFAAYLRHADPLIFDAVFTRFGLVPSKAWRQVDQSPTGRALLTPERTYRAWWSRPHDPLQEIEDGAVESDRFRSWHWVHRMQMAARTFGDWRRAAYDFGRIRVRDLLSTPWGKKTGADGVPDIALTGGGTRVATIGDVVTSERGVALLVRWHVFRPADLVSANAAASLLRQTLATVGRPAGAPSSWPDSFEDQFVAALAAAPPTGINSFDDVLRWPRWQANNPSGFALDLDALLAAAPGAPTGYVAPTDISRTAGLLSARRGSFLLDAAGLPPAPDYAQAGQP
ncbi:MAG: peptidoglycan-binding protein [Acidimicrobiia bacterium]